MILLPDQEDIHKKCNSEDIKDRLRAAWELNTYFSDVPDKSKAWHDLIKLTKDENSDVRRGAALALRTAFGQVPDKNQAWQDLVRLTQDEDNDVRWRAALALRTAFGEISDENQAWKDLHRLTQDEDSSVRWRAAEGLVTTFGQVPDKNQAWQDLVRLTQDEDNDVRWRAAECLVTAFGQVPDKNQAWQDLVRLTRDEKSYVRWRAAKAVGMAFWQVPDKNQAWQDLVRLTQDEKNYVQDAVALAMRTAFGQVPDKNQAWQDLVRLTQDKDNNVRKRAAKAMVSAFNQFPDKNHVWLVLHRLTQDESYPVRLKAAKAMISAFGQIPEKNNAWQDLVRLTQDENSYVRDTVASALRTTFCQVPDKNQAWKDLIRLTQGKKNIVRDTVALALGTAFGQVPDKNQAWRDLHRLTQDESIFLRGVAARALGTAFDQVPDKNQAWKDLHRLTQDKDSSVRWRVAEGLKTTFGQVPDKDQAWKDLHRLTQDEDSSVRWRAARIIGTAFDQAPDKSRAWQDLHRLAQDGNSFVRHQSARSLGTAFDHIPDKSKAWLDLNKLTQDNDGNVRMNAYYSLGRASVFKAIKTDEKDAMGKELEAAVAYFEKSSQEGVYSPARFCRHFYRSYFAVIFQGAKDEEVQKYLTEAKAAVGSSESRKELLMAVENLAEALREAQRLKDRPFYEISSELETYRWYCDEAAEHMAAAEDKASGAIKLMKTGNLFLEEKIQITIAEIQEKAKQICKITRGSGTEFETPGAELQEATRSLCADDLSRIQKVSSRIVWQLKKFCILLSARDKEKVCEIVEEIEYESEFPEKLNKILTALLCLAPVLEDKSQSLVDVVILTVLPEEFDCFRNRLPGLDQHPDLGSTTSLYAWKFGNIFCSNFNSYYKTAVGMIGRAGNNQSALATIEAIRLWRPRCIIFCGIAGGLTDFKEDNAHPKLGDVVVADVIHGYEYGKINRKFEPRSNWTYRTDIALLNGAIAFALSNSWQDHIMVVPPRKCAPKVISGEVASGDQVIDDPTNDFFAQVLKTWPKIIAVEMEGVGAAAAIEQANSFGISVRFMMIRGISDIPRNMEKEKGGKERDVWKIYASDAAAAFTIGWIADGLPLPPSN